MSVHKAGALDHQNGHVLWERVGSSAKQEVRERGGILKEDCAAKSRTPDRSPTIMQSWGGGGGRAGSTATHPATIGGQGERGGGGALSRGGPKIHPATSYLMSLQHHRL